MLEPTTLAIIAVVFFVAGLVKGLVGMGMPPIALALLTATVGLKAAIALVLVPAFATNIVQASIGGHARTIVRRTGPFMVTAIVTVLIGAQALSRVDVTYLSLLLGVLLVLYAALGLLNVRPNLSGRGEPFVGIAIGALNGILTGMTGASSLPGVVYLQAIGLQRDALIQALGLLFAGSIVALALAMGGQKLLTIELGLASALAFIPAFAGMTLGRRLRQGLSEATFRRVFYIALLVLGLYIAGRALPGLTGAA